MQESKEPMKPLDVLRSKNLKGVNSLSAVR